MLRAYILIYGLVIALFVALRALHLSWGVLNALVLLALLVALLGNRLLGPGEYIQISSAEFAERIQNRYRSESSPISDLGFTSLFCYGEAYALSRVLFIYPAFLFLIMWLNREVGTMQNGSRIVFGWPVFVSGDRSTYCHPMQLGLKFHTGFTDGTIVLTKSFGGKTTYGPTVVVQKVTNSAISHVWAEHQEKVRALEANGKQVDRQISFETFARISAQA